jgi:YebC/PmpR family DNA-binding regulatory protein
MSGHSKWSTIKRKKAVIDAKRGKVFTKLIKEIMIAARMGGGDVDANPRLRSAVQTARGSNLPNDKIERAIQRGTGDLEGVSYEEVTYEGYGPGGVAILVDALTDNLNRTVAEIRSAFNKRDGKMGAPGSVGYLFDEKGQIRFSKEELDYETIFEAAVEAGAEEVEDADDDWLITTARGDLYRVSGALEEAEMMPTEVQLAKVPQTTVDITDSDTARKVMALIDHLEENEDVQTVWTNFDLSDEVAANLEAE